MAERISVREFARREGCDEKLVRRAINEGRLPRGDDKKLDAALVGAGWRKGNADRVPQGADTGADSADTVVRSDEIEVRDGETPEEAAERLAAAAGGVPKYAESLAKKEHFLALLRELEYRQKEGQLVDLQLARSILFDEARAARDAWLNWPAKHAALIAADLGVEADRVTEVLTTYVHKQLAALGEPSGQFEQG
jgi:hypothetical protein